MRRDLSPISIKSFKNFYNPFGLLVVKEKYGVNRFSTFCRLSGVGYRSLSSLNHKRSRKVKRLFAMYTKSELGHHFLELWSGSSVKSLLERYYG
jgi:hypothetical protein